MPLPNSSVNGSGHTSSPLPSETLATLTMLTVLSESSPSGWSANRMCFVSSSGASYMFNELCMCTDYSKPMSCQGVFEMGFGNELSSVGVEPLCLKCSLKRPYRLTSLSML